MPVPVPPVPIPRELGPPEGSEVPERLLRLPPRWLLSTPLLLRGPFPLSSASAWSCPADVPPLLDALGSDPSPPLFAACIHEIAPTCSSRCAHHLSEVDRRERLSWSAGAATKHTSGLVILMADICELQDSSSEQQ